MLRSIDLTRLDEVCKPEMPGYVVWGARGIHTCRIIYDYLGVCVAEFTLERCRVIVIYFVFCNKCRCFYNTGRLFWK